MKDKIREEFERWLNIPNDKEPEMDFVTELLENGVINNNKQYLLDWAYGFYAGYKSRDKEVEVLGAINKAYGEQINFQDKMLFDQSAEIKKLRDALVFITGTAETIEDAEKVARKTLKEIDNK